MNPFVDAILKEKPLNKGFFLCVDKFWYIFDIYLDIYIRFQL